MSNKILIVGALACLSAVAVAQSDQSQKSASPSPAPSTKAAQSPASATSAQPADQRMHKPITVTAEVSSHDVASGKATGKKMASDDWEAPAAKSSDPKSTPTPTRVATGDVNGDGKADVAAPKTGQATLQNTSAASSDVKSPRDIATGQASGKRQHEPVTKQSDPAPKQK